MRKIVYIGENREFCERLRTLPEVEVLHVQNVVAFNNAVESLEDVSLILSDNKLKGLGGFGIFKLYKDGLYSHKVPFAIVLPDGSDQALRRQLLDGGISEIYFFHTDPQVIYNRISFLREMLQARVEGAVKPAYAEYQIPLGKRLFDIGLASLALIIAVPFIVFTILAIKLESRGPILYISKRVGTGYRVFDFYKFRSMYTDADKRISRMKETNQYTGTDNTEEGQSKVLNEAPITLIYKDGRRMDEQDYLKIKKHQRAATFWKFKDDPRITKVGRFIRNTSIDELPQLLNVLKGDMSIVGNRPLPLYEAEQLTSDDWSERFLAPAGITGLWQVARRGKSEMSAEERKALDNHYAQNVGVWNDLRLILLTVPALFQKENV